MAALLWLHGVGDTGAGWKGQFTGVAKAVPGVKFHHPTAPEQPLTCSGGEVTTSWFDIVTWQPPMKPIGLEEPDRPTGLDATVKLVHEHFEAIEKSGVPADKIVVGGFSQGGTAAILAGLTYPKKIAGIASISGWATYRDELPTKVNPASTAVPCAFCCGTRDSVIDNKLSKKSGEVLKAILGDSLTYMETNRSEHFQTTSEMKAIEQFIVKCLS